MHIEMWRHPNSSRQSYNQPVRSSDQGSRDQSDQMDDLWKYGTYLGYRENSSQTCKDSFGKLLQGWGVGARGRRGIVRHSDR